MNNLHECTTVQYRIIMNDSKLWIFCVWVESYSAFIFSVSYFIFGLKEKRDFSAFFISIFFRFFMISDFRFRMDSDIAWMQDSWWRADSRAEAGSESEPNRTPTPWFASAFDKNTLSFAIFLENHCSIFLPHLCLHSIFFLVYIV